MNVYILLLIQIMTSEELLTVERTFKPRIKFDKFHAYYITQV